MISTRKVGEVGMPDREQVLTWLEICGKNNDCSGCCPYSENGFGEYGQCRESLMADAYDLLKEQEAVKPKCKERMGGFVTGLCPTCGTALNNIHNVKACGKCGRAVMWDDV